MTRRSATVAALLVTAVLYLATAWAVSAIAIPADTPTARTPWFRPFRVLATLGFTLAGVLDAPHVIGQFLAAIVLGGLFGAVFATVRHWLQ
jgi:hypothetical protein